MAGFQRVFVAAMLQPVEALSDDDAVRADTPMKRPAGKAKASPTPKVTPKAKPVTTSTKVTPKSKPVTPKAKAKGSKGMKRPAASVEGDGGSAESAPVSKKPAVNVLKIYKYRYKSTGVWGFKKNGKEVFVRLTCTYSIYPTSKRSVPSLSVYSNSNLFILLQLRCIPRTAFQMTNWKKLQKLGQFCSG